MRIELYGIHVLQIYRETISDGEGLRYAIYLAGCRHACRGCHNPQSWDALNGTLLDEAFYQQIVTEYNEDGLLDGMTISGGDPFYNPEGLCELLSRLKKDCACNIWCYTGYYIEELIADERCHPALAFIDTLIDGPFEMKNTNPALRFRGSSNQRIIPHPNCWKSDKSH